tara:strand:+ start:36 stop:245 length:210 start_codon:yes stop_codon:yes gene_type:complete
MEKIEVKYEQRILIVEGCFFNATFESHSIKCNDLELFDDYDEEQLQDIEGLCLVAIKEDEQTNWEIANA